MAFTEKTSISWRSVAGLVICFVLVLSWNTQVDARSVKEVKRSVGGVWKSADDFKYDSELSQADSKSSPQEDDVYSGLDKQKLVQLVAKLLLERKDLARHVAGRVFDDSVQPAKRQRSLFAGDRGGWGGGYGK